MTGKRHSKVTKMIRDIPHHSNKGAQTSHEKELTDERNLTDRSGWWKDTVKNTPFPGSYHIRDFIEEASLSPVRMTYGFMDSGRNSRIVCMRSGTMLLPGAYSFTDCTQEALRRRASYSFKSCPRPDNYTLGIRDKDIDLSPCHYNVTEKLVPKLPCKHAMFRSATQRLVFLPVSHYENRGLLDQAHMSPRARSVLALPPRTTWTPSMAISTIMCFNAVHSPVHQK
ncbi:protein STPG4 isoform X1 [Ictalurus punctatus]|uniref:Protein STPG4 isoform X1 n=1 Tax=Ictalurus punctatus TaxID=7998 RepID=A0A2D0QLZ1_ICTPU|nr:protein STPG4 isoform X1 [Ictalurus punctatus]